jgi:hypothetical protein
MAWDTEGTRRRLKEAAASSPSTGRLTGQPNARMTSASAAMAPSIAVSLMLP